MDDNGKKVDGYNTIVPLPPKEELEALLKAKYDLVDELEIKINNILSDFCNEQRLNIIFETISVSPTKVKLGCLIDLARLKQ